MRPLSIKIKKSTISTALAVLGFQTGSVYSATVNIQGDRENLPLIAPGAFVELASSNGSFASIEYYAGVLWGTVGTIDTAFFCAELNDSISAGDVTYTSSTLEDAVLKNGTPVNAGLGLTDQQKCMLMGVYESLLITAVNGFVDETTDNQNLLGTTTVTDANKLKLSGLSHERAAAAQLVIWEIIHEPVSSYYYGNAPIIGLTNGDLQWSLGYKSSPHPPDPAEFPANWATITAEFDDIAFDAYAHAAATCGLVAVPEITSPVALLAGGLLFVRRREQRSVRMKKPSGASNKEPA